MTSQFYLIVLLTLSKIIDHLARGFLIRRVPDVWDGSGLNRTQFL